jgi:hypothetical protein
MLSPHPIEQIKKNHPSEDAKSYLNISGNCSFTLVRSIKHNICKRYIEERNRNNHMVKAPQNLFAEYEAFLLLGHEFAILVDFYLVDTSRLFT